MPHAGRKRRPPDALSDNSRVEIKREQLRSALFAFTSSCTTKTYN